MKKIITILILLFYVLSFSFAQKKEKDTHYLSNYSFNANLFYNPDKKAKNWVNKVYKSLTLKEKIGQLVIPFTTTYYLSEDSKSFKELKRQIKKNNIGGFIFSLGDVYSIAELSNALQKLSKVPLLISADFEKGGVAMRVDRATNFPTNMALGATNDENLAFEMGKIIAIEGRALGVQQNYSPVLDVNNNPKNPIINVRSFGEDPYLVAKLGNAYIKGLHQGGMASTVKHFPGHGDTDVDSHSDLPVLNFDRKRLDSVELVPFKSAINNTASVMVAHLHIPILDNTINVPGSLSFNVITKLLKEELGFKGLIVTDGMEMRGITKNFSVAKSSVMAIQAGNDVVLLPPDPDIAINSIYKAVLKGEISQKRIEESVKKILLLKYCLGLDKNKYVNIDEIPKKVNTEKNNYIAKLIARKSVTVLKNENIIPLQKNGDKQIICLSVYDREETNSGRLFERGFSSRYRNVDFLKIDARTNDTEFDFIYNKLKKADLVIIPVYLQVRSYSGSVSFNLKTKKYIDSIYTLKKPIFMLSFGNPYVIADYPTTSTYLTTYGDAPVSIEAGLEAAFGEISISGKLPISIPGHYKIYDGMVIEKTVLGEASPYEFGLKEDAFNKIDDLVNKAIEDSVFPGVSLLIAKDGKVLYNKAFGFYTYDIDSKPITTKTIFDLASVSKVMGTTFAAMKLVDEKKLNLEDYVVKYLPEFGKNGKDKIKIKNLLLHNSGLPPFKLFYKMCSNSNEILDSIYNCEVLFQPGDSTVYSDIGMITLGKVIEKISNMSLDKFLTEYFYKPLGLMNTFYNPNERIKQLCAPTELDNYWRMKLVQGSVHDENAYALGGVAGHAGLFSTTEDLAVLVQLLINKGIYGGKRYLSEEVINKFLTPENRSSNRVHGWGLKSLTGYSSAGSKFSNESFGHTGFTGTSIWVDPIRKVFVILLTNRVYPTRENNKISEFRPILHDKVIECLENPNN